ncbi:DUF742 domain-containing protein [Candidatus Frankia nodulisporulans]|uniref:DUF742 domain-containing protein n=1 Tax=Candidatus Frankia nodulisporulans TaxID=2060052 RepID=UPI0013D37D4C|nr:DUF742 domain-containing protein [Candidatus Frankia nodulisporulans]
MNGDAMEPSGELVRPYAATRGRARPSRLLALEAMVTTTSFGLARLPALLLEQRSIVSMCERPQSVIEIAAGLRLPVGVVRVLVADAAAERLVDVSQLTLNNGAPGLDLLGRVLSSLRRL